MGAAARGGASPGSDGIGRQQQQQLETATPHATPSLAAENADLKADHNALNKKSGIIEKDNGFI